MELACQILRVRIDLRGENVLNSRTEYSRCRIPRLTIDKEEWKKAKKKEIEVLERDGEVHGDETEEGHQEAVAAGQEEVKRTQMKRKVSHETRASKRQRLETLVDWGEGEERENLEMEGIQRWLGLSGGVQQREDWNGWSPETCVNVKKTKQLELGFTRKRDDMETGGEMENTFADEPLVTTKRRRRMTLKQIAVTNKKITSWIKEPENKVKKNENDSHESIDDGPALDEPEDIIQREIAREKSRMWRVKYSCKQIVNALVENVMARSLADYVMAVVVNRAFLRIKISMAWGMLENDNELQDIMKKKMFRQERDTEILLNMMEKDDRLQTFISKARLT